MHTILIFLEYFVIVLFLEFLLMFIAFCPDTIVNIAIEAKNQIYWNILTPIKRLIFMRKIGKRFQIHQTKLNHLLEQVDKDIESCQSIDRLFNLLNAKNILFQALRILNQTQYMQTERDFRSLECEVAKLETSSHSLYNEKFTSLN